MTKWGIFHGTCFPISALAKRSSFQKRIKEKIIYVKTQNF